MNKIIVIILCVLTFGLSGIFAQKVDKTCAINGWIGDPEIPKIDMSIRSKPNFSSKSLLEIHFVSEHEEIIKLEMIGYSNDYIKIRKATNMNGEVVFKGIGWVYYGRVEIGILRSDRNLEKQITLYAAPNSASKKVVSIPNYYKDYIITGFSCWGLKLNAENKTGWIPRKSLCETPEEPCIEKWIKPQTN